MSGRSVTSADKTAVPVRPIWTGDVFVAHTPAAGRPGVWHLLQDHLRGTSQLAYAFAQGFGGGSISRFAGLVHDSGKATEDVQCALRRCARTGERRLGTPHKGEGAELAHLVEAAGHQEAAIALYLMIWGHHSGIPDWDSTSSTSAIQLHKEMAACPHRLDRLVDALDDLLQISLEDEAANVDVPEFVREACSQARSNIHQMETLELFTRMCHSALVDADFLDTAGHFDGTGTLRMSSTIDAGQLANVFFGEYERRFSNATASPVNTARRHLFDQARACGQTHHAGTPIFRLPANTGMGKTLAAAAFALEHARTNGQNRIVVAVPFTSITTQNAHTYRDMFGELGDQIVLEHHSNIIDPDVADHWWRKQAAENWDAPFIVTTTVQLFDSLFSNRPAATRKLHRLANSVLVLDEVQALPRGAVPAILTALRDLTEHYNTTVVLASATQPRFWQRPEWQGMELCDLAEPTHGTSPIQRVTYEVRSQEQDWNAIADELASQERVLAIVNTTSDAQLLHQLVRDRLPQDAVVRHLSTLMCGQHRADVLDEVARRLDQGLPIRLISTQCIEAGVDVDFPVVYRALGPADSVMQSAGRCNREGKMRQPGHVIVFRPRDGKLPPGEYTRATLQTLQQFVIIPETGTQPRGRFDAPASLDDYYAALDVAGVGEDMSRKVSEARSRLNFMVTANEFKMIDSTSIGAVVTAYGPPDVRDAVAAALAQLVDHPDVPLKTAQRQLLQRFTISLPPYRVTPEVVAQFNVPGSNGILQWIGEYDAERGAIVNTKEALVW